MNGAALPHACDHCSASLEHCFSSQSRQRRGRASPPSEPAFSRVSAQPERSQKEVQLSPSAQVEALSAHLLARLRTGGCHASGSGALSRTNADNFG